MEITKMKTITTSEFEGGEVGLTKYITDHFMNELMELLSMTSEGVSHIAEDRSLKGARPDITSTDENGDVVLVVECQSASGSLDGTHLNKIYGYLARNHCTEGVLLCEDTPEDIRDEVVGTNKDSSQSSSLHVVTYKLYDNGHVEFTLNCTPTKSTRSAKYERSGVTNSSAKKAVAESKIENFEIAGPIFNDYLASLGKVKPSRKPSNTTPACHYKVDLKEGVSLILNVQASYFGVTFAGKKLSEVRKGGATWEEFLVDLNKRFNSEEKYAWSKHSKKIPAALATTEKELISLTRDAAEFVRENNL